MQTRNILLVIGHHADARGKVSRTLLDRAYRAFSLLEEALEAIILQRNNFPTFDAVVLCGGHTAPDAPSEAEALRSILVGLATGTSILPELLLDTTSFNTLEKITNGTRLLMERYSNPEDPLFIQVVTHDWHASQVQAYWQKSECLVEARARCQLSVPFVVRPKSLRILEDFARRFAAWESTWDPNRTLLNWVRPHAV